jgi:hypothetical protein
VSLVLTRLVAEGLAERSGTTIYIPSVSALTERLDNSRLDGEVPLTVTGEIPLAVRD